MTWQEELSRLDEALAGGRLSADEYRRRRDEVLAGSPSGGPPAPQSQGQGPQSTPFPSPFRWEAQPPQNAGAPADRTQVVPNTGATQSGSSDRTQVVQNVPSRQDQTQAIGGGDTSSERTQFVRPPQQSWQSTPPQQDFSGVAGSPPPWATGDADQINAPQWGGGFQTHGPEVFDDKPSGKGKIIAVIAVVLVLAAGAVLYFTVFNKNNNAGGGGTTPPSSTSQSPTKKKPEPFGSLIVPEGRTSGPKTYTAAQLETVKPLPAPDLLKLKQGSATEARSVVVVDSKSVTNSLWAFKTADPAALRDAIDTDQTRFGFAEVTADSKTGAKVFEAKLVNGAKTTFVKRAHYAADGEMIRVEVLGTDQDAVNAVFKQIFAEQLTHTPIK